MNYRLRYFPIATIFAICASAVSTQTLAYEATLTGNAGILSDYIYRGIPQNDSSGNGGVDLEIGGFYLGTWIADVDSGLEYDIYGGYVHEFANGVYLGAGYTTYQYSDDFDDDYNEVNFYAGWSNEDLSVDFEITTGEYDGEFSDGDNYDFYSATVNWKGAYITYGMFDDDAEDDLGSYYEFGYGFDVAGFDVTAAIVHTDADILDGAATSGDDEDESQAYVGIHRTFDIMSWGSGS